MIKVLLKNIFLLIVLFQFVSVSQATVYTISVTGVIDEIILKNGFQLDESVNLETQMTGYCTFDTDNLIATPWSNDEYPLDDISMTIGNYTFTHDDLSDGKALLTDYADEFIYGADSDSPFFSGSIYDESVSKTWHDIDWSYTYLHLFGVWTLTEQNSLEDYFTTIEHFTERNEFYVLMLEQHPTVSWKHDGEIRINGHLTSMSITPEPGSLFLLSFGILHTLKRKR